MLLRIRLLQRLNQTRVSLLKAEDSIRQTGRCLQGIFVDRFAILLWSHHTDRLTALAKKEKFIVII